MKRNSKKVLTDLYNYGIRSTNEKDYYNYVDYSDVFEELIDDYGQVFSHSYGHDYFEMYIIISNLISNCKIKIKF